MVNSFSRTSSTFKEMCLIKIVAIANSEMELERHLNHIMGFYMSNIS